MTDDFKLTAEEEAVVYKKLMYPKALFSKEELNILSNLKNRLDAHYGK